MIVNCLNHGTDMYLVLIFITHKLINSLFVIGVLPDFMLGRLLYNGFFDFSFGTDGLVLTDISEDTDVVNGLALNADQSRIYAGGRAIHFSNNRGTVACYHTGLGVGISAPETGHQKISIYPNPGNDIINIETDTKQQGKKVIIY